MTDAIFCQIRVKGHLSHQWSDWFSGLEIENEPGGQAVLSGTLRDQAALYGVLNRMRNLGLELVSVNCVEPNPDGTPPPGQPGDENDEPTRGGDVRNQLEGGT